jgi:tetratricopeptide (TPR) repeat protein
MNQVARKTQNVLAGVVFAAGSLSAQELDCSDSVSQYRSALADSGQCPAPFSVLNHLGGLYYAAGRYAEAAPIFERALALREAELGVDAPGLLPLLNQAGLLSRESADYRRARQLANRARAIAESETCETLDGAAAFVNLGAIAEVDGDVTEARKWLNRALPIRQRLLGPGHPLVAETLSDLALTYRMDRQFTRAGELYRAALAILEVSPETVLAQKNTGAVLNNLGQVEAEQGHLKEAEQILRKSIAEMERTLGPEHPNTAAGLLNLATILRCRHRYSEAEQVLRRAEQIDELRFAPDHPRIAHNLSLQAALAFDRKKYGDAERLFTESLAILTKRLPPAHPEIGRTIANMAEVYLRQKRLLDAEQAYERALTILEQSEGPNNPELLPTMEHYALLLRARQDFAKAADLDSRVMKIRVTQTLKRAA